MTIVNRKLALCCIAVLAAACSDQEGRSVTVGERPSGPGAAGADPDNPEGGAAGVAGSGPNSNALTVDVEDIAGLTIEVITLTCDARCAEVVAVASGGNPEYTYRWEDGSTDPHRRVCLDADAQLSVSATDTPIVTEEFSYAAKTVSADLTADVVECADAGPLDPPGGPLCVKNPSFEGHAPGIGYGEAGSLADDWTVCSATPDVCPFGDPFCTLPATDGSAYLGFGWYSLDVESAGGEFCSPLQPGRAVSFAVDIAISPGFSGVPVLEIWGGATACAADELLWRSPPITNTEWQTYCVTFTPIQSLEHFVILHEPIDQVGSPYISLDNIRAHDGNCE